MAVGPEPDTFQKFVRWLVLAFFIYICVHSYFQKIAPAPPPQPQHVENNIPPVPDCDKKKPFPLSTINFFPLFVPTVHNEDSKLGEGAPAFCGQHVKFDYEYTLADKKIDKGTQTATIGEGSVYQGVELALIGMKKGGVRSVMVPEMFAKALKNPPKGEASTDKGFLAKLTLLEATPSLPASPFPLHVVNTEGGEQKRVNCGDKIKADITIWKLDGSIFYSSSKEKPVVFTIGNSDVPFGLEQAAISTPEGGSRTVILPPGAMNQPLIKHESDFIGALPPLPDEITIVQLENVVQTEAKDYGPSADEIKSLLHPNKDYQSLPFAEPTPTAQPATTPELKTTPDVSTATPSPTPQP